MRLFRLVVCACALLPATVSRAATLSEEKVGFTADRTLVIDGKSYVGRMTAMPGRERHEQRIQGFEPVFLLRSDTPLGHVVLANLHTTVQFVIPAELHLLDSPTLRKHPAGEEKLEGIATTKYAIDETVPQGHATGTLWLSAQGIPMKLEGKFAPTQGRKVTKIRWELHHVKIGPQPDTLFEAPAGFSKLPAEAVAPLLGLRLESASAH